MTPAQPAEDRPLRYSRETFAVQAHARPLGGVQPIPVKRSHPVDDPDWLFEPKHDAFRGIVYIAGTECLIRSKRGGPFKRCGSLAAELATWRAERRGYRGWKLGL